MEDCKRISFVGLHVVLSSISYSSKSASVVGLFHCSLRRASVDYEQELENDSALRESSAYDDDNDDDDDNANNNNNDDDDDNDVDDKRTASTSAKVVSRSIDGMKLLLFVLFDETTTHCL